MKDELNGKVIKEAYFLGIKQYGYQYLENDKLITKTVFSGVERDVLTFDEIIKLHNGETLTQKIKPRFYKSFSKMDISIVSNMVLTIKKGCKKTILGNKYIPLHLENDNFTTLLSKKLVKAKLIIKNIFKHIHKIIIKNITPFIYFIRINLLIMVVVK